ncbi:cytochrome c oxidase assembly protein [Alkalicoccobacillus porphyridii]
MIPQLILASFFLMGLIGYLVAVVISNQSYKQWPLHRIICAVSGSFCATVAVFGPLADLGHLWFPAHMMGHLLLGMLAPLLLVLAAPMSLLLRTLPVQPARFITRLLKSWVGQISLHPIFTTLINVGGLWLLYTTELYPLMHEYVFLHLFIHLHVFIAGYLFTASILYIDPISHRLSYLYRSIVLILALAAHNILSKYLYAQPPNGVPGDQAQLGSQIMYYGGDAVDLAIIFILCLQWYKTTRPRSQWKKESTLLSY